MSPVNDPATYWLNVTNLLLGLITLVCVAAVAAGVIQELAARRKKRTALAGLDAEVSELVTAFGDGHAFHSPALGMTMADGGEPIDGKPTSPGSGIPAKE
jgi:hypothetical protein